jgi:LacI family repressor for deo operon, udp, cdd, tsx, nupC, and nupG
VSDGADVSDGAARPPRSTVTINDVAQLAGVSKATVSLILSGRPGPAQSTRERVTEVAHRLGWRPSPQARGLSMSRTSAIGLVMARDPEVFALDPFFSRFVAGVEIALRSRDYALVLRITGEAPGEEEATYRFMAHHRADGVLLTDLRLRDERFALLAALGLPAVAVGHPVGACPLPTIGPDDDADVHEAVRHLVALGHRRVAHVGGPLQYVHSHHRARIFDRAARAHGLTTYRRARGDFTADSGRRATVRLLELVEPPTAIVYDNDLMAAAGLGAARDAGRRVPEDLSILSLDRSQLGELAHPPLTGIMHDVVTWGRQAAEVLLCLIDGQQPAPPSLPPSLLEAGRSAGPAPR